jgi:deoxyribonuclease (pyrimidine dimer)
MRKCKPDWGHSITVFFLGICAGFILCHKIYTGIDTKGESKVTRINIVPVEELSVKHLVAEYREIARLPNNLTKSLNRKSKPFSMDEIPASYTLDTGHVKFFYDKMGFLEARFEQLVTEMIKRGYNPSYRDGSIFSNCPTGFYNDYEPTEEAIKINRDRIRERSGNVNVEK